LFVVVDWVGGSFEAVDGAAGCSVAGAGAGVAVLATPCTGAVAGAAAELTALTALGWVTDVTGSPAYAFVTPPASASSSVAATALIQRFIVLSLLD
jgi:hypothetical protein